MKNPFKKSLLSSLFLSSLLLGGCGGASETETESDSDTYESSTSLNNLNTLTTSDLRSVTENTSLPIQAKLLASQCAQCHGTYGLSVTGIDSILNEADEFIEEMAEYRSKTSHIMHPHALAYSDAELTLMSQYFMGLSGTAITSGDRDDD